MKFVIGLILFLSCLCNLQGQVWLKVADSAAFNNFDVLTATVDSVSNTLYVGGYFSNVNQLGDIKGKAILKYNGSYLDTLAGGLNNHNTAYTRVYTMQMFQNKLYVFGQFEKTGNYWCKNVGRWNGSSWDTINYGNANGYATLSDVYNNELYVAGYFDTIGGIPANCIAKFDGTSWYSLGHPLPKNNVCIKAMKNFKGKLYISAATSVASSCANLQYYDVSTSSWIPWVGVSGNAYKTIWGMTVIDSMLYVYGRFDDIGGTNCKGLAAFNGTKWYGFGSGLSTSGGWETIMDVKKINGEIYVTGKFDKIEGVGSPTLYTDIMKFDGQKWCTISPSFENDVYGVIKYNNNMYCYGAFGQIGNDTILGLAKWLGGNSTIACSPTIAITPSTIGINEITNINGLIIYPNPALNTLYISSDEYIPKETEIEIINTLGQTVLKLNYTSEIDVSELSSGSYILKISDSLKRQFYSKFLKE